ncbi:hypothetical protein LTR50_003830 [Elasticomyces elasticus]|nr:hypothetical protein LTR50_003830 [Elasticomyces elasticus]
MPPKSKRRKNDAGWTVVVDRDAPSPKAPDRSTWEGWCEIESEPAFFNVILQELGIQNIRVHEVFGLDDDYLAILPKPVHAMIFLFRYREEDHDMRETACPDHVWFANQIPTNACATIALLNIVNNIPSLDMGPHLQSFKEFTLKFDPLSRGYAIDSFEFVKRTHNSFARENDMLNMDLTMKLDSVKDNRKRKTSAKASRSSSPKSRSEAKAESEADADFKIDPETRSRNDSKVASPTALSTKANTPVKRTRAAANKASRKMKRQAADAAKGERDDDDDDGFHFIAYVPIENVVWKLDGMDSFPQKVGKADGGDWLDVIRPVLQSRMAQYSEGQIEFSLMALVKDPIVEARALFAENIKSIRMLEKRLDKLNAEWGAFLAGEDEDEVQEATIEGASEKYCIATGDVEEAVVPAKVRDWLTLTDVEALMRRRWELITTQRGLRRTVQDEMDSAQMDVERAMHRRHNYGAVVQQWLRDLTEEGALAPLLDDPVKDS